MTASTRHAIAAAALLSSAAVATACGHTAGGSGSGPRSAPPASTATSTPSTPAGTSACATSALRVVVATTQAGAAAGSTYYPINFTNTSQASCTLFGYPGVSFVAASSGSGQIGKPATRNAATAPQLVTLAPGGTAHAVFQVAQAGNYPPSVCKPVTAHWLRVFPPDQTAAAIVGFTSQVCSATGSHLAGSQLGVTPVVPGPGKRQ
ncbi:MAG TPA: DUF4232 domain-containing protein [Streptosporangiaceae bacterium]|nr:DUF4232 domain-containing protein [Streptosporangiaceae bacterium]